MISPDNIVLPADNIFLSADNMLWCGAASFLFGFGSEKIFYAAPASTLLYSKPSFWKQTKVNLRIRFISPSEFCMIKMVTNLNGKSKKRCHVVTFLIIPLWLTWSLDLEPHRVTAPAPTKWCGLLAASAPQHCNIVLSDDNIVLLADNIR
jgi:hypothetical protein